MRFLRLFGTQSCYRLRIRCRRLIRDKIPGACDTRHVHIYIYIYIDIYIYTRTHTREILPPRRGANESLHSRAFQSSSDATSGSRNRCVAPRCTAPRRANHRRNNVKSGILAQPAGLGRRKPSRRWRKVQAKEGRGRCRRRGGGGGGGGGRRRRSMHRARPYGDA